MEDDRGIFIGDECEVDMQNLGGRLVLMLMRAGILVGGNFLWLIPGICGNLAAWLVHNFLMICFTTQRILFQFS